MLEIKKVSKQYKTGDLVQNALSSVSLEFRSNEFVAVLGPSGSGKTTLLNIIGGPARGTRLIIMISASTAAGSCFFQSFLIKSPSMMSDLLPFGYIIFLSITYSKALSKS